MEMEDVVILLEKTSGEIRSESRLEQLSTTLGFMLLAIGDVDLAELRKDFTVAICRPVERQRSGHNSRYELGRRRARER